jgi:polyhydroxyalkanoate synthesis regulator phasin
MVLDRLKDKAARKMGAALASDAAMKVVSDPRVQGAMLRAINMRGELREAVERRVSTIATALDLVTRDDVATLRRTIRDLEDSVEDMREELDEARTAAKKAEQEAIAAKAAAARASEGTASKQAPARKRTSTAAAKRKPTT